MFKIPRLILLILISFSFQKSDVYFTKDISPSSIVTLYKLLNLNLKGKIGLKVHTGEIGGKYYLTPKFLEEIYDYTKGTFIECNAAYKGGRHTTDLHKELLKNHSWSDYNTVIMDEYGENKDTQNKDIELEIKNPVKISKNYVGGKLKDFDSALVLTHFKGHSKVGFGGTLKQLSTGFASQRGKAYIYSAGKSTDWENKEIIEKTSLEDYIASMGDAAASIVEYFRNRGGIGFISVVANISLDCDCKGASQPEPKIYDIGILASTDPIAIDTAALDIIKARLQVPATQDFLAQITNSKGTDIITSALTHNIGTQKYNLIDIDKPRVFFTREISPDSVVKMFKQLNYPLGDKIGLKVHTGEAGGKYFLTPDFLQKIYDYTGGTFIECNTAYNGKNLHYTRSNTKNHTNLLDYHGWNKNGRRIVIMDENPDKNFNLTVDNYTKIPNNIVGEHLKDFDSALVLAHFNGHGAGGFGGALKQLSIGFASQAGKTNIHTAGVTSDWHLQNTYWASQENFTSSMGDAASTIVKYFRERKGIAFINVLANISLYCDCSGSGAPEPRIKDIGILASTDPVAIDRASVDLLRAYTDLGTFQLLEQIKFLKGENTIDVAEKHGIGLQTYNLIDVDEHDPPLTDTVKEEDENIDKTTFFITVGVISCVCLILITVVFILCFKRKSVDTNVGSVSLINRETNA